MRIKFDREIYDKYMSQEPIDTKSSRKTWNDDLESESIDQKIYADGTILEEWHYSDSTPGFSESDHVERFVFPDKNIMIIYVKRTGLDNVVEDYVNEES